MSPVWVVQSNVARKDRERLVNTLLELNEPVVEATIEEGELRVPTGLCDDLIPYGSIQLVRYAQKMKWKHLFFDPSTFCSDVYLSSHPKMLNSDAITTTLSEVKYLVNHRPEWFIRPVNDFKDFAGMVMNSEELKSWISRLEQGDCDIDGSCLVVMSSPKSIQMEWRYFIVDGKVVTGSSYRYKNAQYIKRELDPDVLIEAQGLADIWLPHRCCCMDVALFNNIPYIVEFNGINASGFYDIDIEIFAREVSNYAKNN